jgi:hypothetical protein
MVEVEYQPRNKVIIHEYARYESVEHLIKGAFSNIPPGANVGSLKWVGGLVMTQTPYPMTDTIIKELIAGRLHWDHVSFAPMDEYSPNIHVPDIRLTVTINDVSVNPVFRAIAKFIVANLMETKE